MWTTESLTNAGGWDLFTFIFFAFILYKACTKQWRELIFLAIKRCFDKAKNEEEKKIRLKYRGYVLVGILVFLFLIITWLSEVVNIFTLFD